MPHIVWYLVTSNQARVLLINPLNKYGLKSSITNSENWTFNIAIKIIFIPYSIDSYCYLNSVIRLIIIIAQKFLFKTVSQLNKFIQDASSQRLFRFSIASHRINILNSTTARRIGNHTIQVLHTPRLKKEPMEKTHLIQHGPIKCALILQ